MAQQTRIMAVINASPESFYGGSVAVDAETIAAACRAAEAAGAHMLDVGAMSTAPYQHAHIAEDAEAARMAIAIAAARGASTLPISADTQRYAPARAALDAGANVINDVTALLTDPRVGDLIAERQCGVVLMANDDPKLDEAGESPTQVVTRLLASAIARAESHGIAREKIIVDPGVGFFRHRSIPWHEWDMELIRNAAEFRTLGCPVLIGVSRKSLFKKVLGREKPEDRLAGSLAVAGWCAAQGIEWLRVHDVAETRDVIEMQKLMSRNS